MRSESAYLNRRTGACRGFARIKERNVKRILLAIGSLALVAMLGISMIGNAVDAQDTATPEAGDGTAVGGQTTETQDSAKDAYLAALAANLGVTTDELQAAIDATNTDLGVEGGVMGGFKGGKGDGHRGGHDESRGDMGGRAGSSMLRGVDAAAAAVFLGITEDELKTQIDGSTFLAIALANGKTTEDVRAFLIEQATAQIDERLQAATDASAGAQTTEPATDGTSISEATEVPTAPAMTPTATA